MVTKRGNAGMVRGAREGRLVRGALLRDERLRVAALNPGGGQVLVTGFNREALVIVDFGRFGPRGRVFVNGRPSRGVKRISLSHNLEAGVGEEEVLLRVYRLLGVPVPNSAEGAPAPSPVKVA